MKNLLFVLFSLFSFSNFLVAQNVGDQKPQGEIFGSQPVRTELKKTDTLVRMTVSKYFSCHQGDYVLMHNAITDGMAQVEKFLPTDLILVLTRGGKDYLYKDGCLNRLKYIKTVLGHTPAPIIFYDTVHVRVIEKTVIVEKYQPEPEPEVGTGVRVGARIRFKSMDWCPAPAPMFPAKDPITGNWSAPTFVDQRGAYWNWR